MSFRRPKIVELRTYLALGLPNKKYADFSSARSGAELKLNERMIFICWLIFYLGCSSNDVVSGQSACGSTVRGGPAEFKRCVFPFVFKGTSYNGCTTQDDPDGLEWCSVKTDARGHHITGQGYWGYCNLGCGRSTVGSPIVPRAQGPDDHVHFGGTTRRVPTPSPSPGQRLVEPRPTTARTTVSRLERPTPPTARPRPRTTTRRAVFTTRRTSKAPRTTARVPVPITIPPRRTPDTPRKRDPTPGRNDNFKGSSSQNRRRGDWIPDPGQQECGYQTNVGFIIGGSQALRGEYPFAAVLGFTGFGDGRTYYLCGGSLINRRYVMTAAHCHSKAGPVSQQISEVVLGEFDISKDPDCDGCMKKQVFEIRNTDVRVHPEFSMQNPLAGHDIALIRLPRLAITIVDSPDSPVLPGCLPWTMPSILRSTAGEVAGWGRLTNNPTLASQGLRELGVQSRTLQKVGVNIVPTAQCEQAYGRSLEPHYLCAGGERGKD